MQTDIGIGVWRHNAALIGDFGVGKRDRAARDDRTLDRKAPITEPLRLANNHLDVAILGGERRGAGGQIEYCPTWIADVTGPAAHQLGTGIMLI
ncbi:MAG: hypothetical protein JO008_00585 [Alphaproteobacteria bacterium]|nr:hypothetical protein [Alphaproteobacteria bacterium]